MRVGEKITLRIEKLVFGGRGLARYQNQVIFVEGVIPDELVSCEIVAIRRGYAEARLLSVIEVSSERVHPPCPLYGICGGCQLQHISAPAQLRIKQEMLRESLVRLGGLREGEALSPIPSPFLFGYRRRVQFRVQRRGKKRQIGFYQWRSHRVIPVEECLLLPAPVNAALKLLSAFLADEERLLPDLREVQMSLSTKSGEIIMSFLTHFPVTKKTGERLWLGLSEKLSLAGIVFLPHRGKGLGIGKGVLIEEIEGLPVRISEGTFSQVNWEVNALVIRKILEFADLTGTERGADLFCGGGNFSLPLAGRAKEVIGIDDDPLACEDARFNGKRNGLTNLRIWCADVEEAIGEMVERKEGVDLLLLDPPREGVSQLLIDRIISLLPPKILYVSCDPATLARDLALFVEKGYHLGRIQPFDMFPQTYHIETLAELTKERRNTHG